MENQFIVSQLRDIAAAVTQIELQNNNVKNAICVLLGYIQADENFNLSIQGGIPTQQQYEVTEPNEILEFTQKEISKMPKQFKTLFKTNGVRAHVRKRTRNSSVSYEIRFRSDGYNISASGITLEEAKVRFIQKLNDLKDGRKPAAPDVPKTFDKFAMYYFEKFRKRKVCEDTYKKDLIRLRKHILPVFGSMPLKEITPPFCQQFIDRLADEGRGRTVEEVFSLMNCTFKIAIKHNLIQHNPLDIVIHDKHERQHGKALTVEEEKHLLEIAAEPFKTVFAIALYTGIRPNEYKTVRITENMIYARNSKRHNGKEETKRIPIIPMLRPYITPDTVMPIMSLDRIRAEFKAVFGESHRLYDLRTTFYTRCQMCNVAPAARDEFVGHSEGKLSNTYTDLPDDYLIKEGQKLDY